MADTTLRLSDKTIFLIGPLHHLQQTLANTLCELGADVAIVTNQERMARLFADNLNDSREINARHGRAAALVYDPEDSTQMDHHLSTASQSLGSIDGVIDTRLGFYLEKLNDCEDSPAALAQSYLEETKQFWADVTPYLASKAKGRFLMTSYSGLEAEHRQDQFLAEVNKGLKDHMHSQATEWIDKCISINWLQLGITEEFLLCREPQKNSIQKTLEDLDRPGAKILDNQEVAVTISFFMSPLSQSLTGHHIFADRGEHLSHGSK